MHKKTLSAPLYIFMFVITSTYSPCATSCAQARSIFYNLKQQCLHKKILIPAGLGLGGYALYRTGGLRLLGQLTAPATKASANFSITVTKKLLNCFLRPLLHTRASCIVTPTAHIKAWLNNTSPLLEAAKAGLSTGFGRLLGKNQININALNSGGKRPLHQAVEAGNIAAVQWLLDHGADVTLTDLQGYLPIDIAKIRNLTTITTLLKQKEKFVECVLCYSHVPSSDIARLACGHNYYCHTCMNAVLDQAIQARSTEVLQCPSPLCHYGGHRRYLTPKELRSFTTPSKLESIERLFQEEDLLKQGFVRCRNHACPSLYNLAQAQAQGQLRRCNTCNIQHCLFCRDTHKMGEACQQYKLYREDRQSWEWTYRNTRQCPRCHIAVEKNKGCNHMECRNCSYHFCWLCLENFASYEHRCPGKHRPTAFDPQ